MKKLMSLIFSGIRFFEFIHYKRTKNNFLFAQGTTENLLTMVYYIPVTFLRR